MSNKCIYDTSYPLMRIFLCHYLTQTILIRLENKLVKFISIKKKLVI